MIIEVNGVTFSFSEDGKVLDNISLTIEKGTFTAILGRNGSGKSTLAKHFNALLLPNDGAVYVKGMDTRDEMNTFNIRSCAGMVFQNPDNQMVAAIAEDEIAFAPENLGIEPSEIRRRVDESLKTVGMSEYSAKTVSMLSGGQKQRIAIAAVLAMKPEILILDEPTAMLDPSGRHDVMKTVKELNRENGMTVILITHYMEEAAQADRIVVIDNGRIIADDTPRGVFRQTKLMKSAGLDVPQMTELMQLLRESGIDVSDDVLSVDEALGEIVKVLGVAPDD